MTKELDIVRADILSPEESRALDAELDRIIHRYKGNRKEINKLVFESIACMTEADEAQTALSSKGFFKRLWVGSAEITADCKIKSMKTELLPSMLPRELYKSWLNRT